MISVNQALDLVKNQVYKLDKNKTIPTKDALGYVLYRDVFSPIDMPPFRQSAMDGYAVSTHNDQVYNLVGEVKAGDDANPILKKGDAVRIFTGAAVPDDADAVVIQEKVTRSDKQISISDTIKPQANIRPQGEQIKKGDLALSKGTRLSPSGIAYLLSLGVTEVNVYKKPRVSIIVTGNELIKPGSELSYGKIYESNGEMLKSALLELNFNEVKLYATEDDFQSTKAIIEKALAKQ
jgi:molybdopterin molybdotransferase